MQVPEHIQQAFSLMEQGRGAEAVELLNRLAAAGDPPACYQLAEWSHEGEIVIRDFALARDLYLTAAKAGLLEAYRRYMALVAIGAGFVVNFSMSHFVVFRPRKDQAQTPTGR